MKTRSKAGSVQRAVMLTAVMMLLTTLLAPAADASGGGRVRNVKGMVIVESDRGFEETWGGLIGALEANPNIGIVATIDHAAAAASVGLDLAPNRVVVFGNPALGSPLMAAIQTTGLDLPQKIQVFEQDGRTWVGFNDTTFLQARHGLGDEPTLAVISGALRNLESAAAGLTVDAGPAKTGPLGKRPGIVSVPSDAGMDETWGRLLSAIEASPANVAYTVDHQAGADSVGIDLRPTRLVVFGNPNLGTPLMQKRATVGIDLPIRFLVWEDADGQVFVTADGQKFGRRHGLKTPDVAPVAGAIANFLNVATQSP